MRDGIIKLGGSPDKVNPLIPVDLVIDHSVMVDVAGTENSLHENVELEFARNGERYRFLRWGSQAFENFRVVPPGTGICHQVNLEYLSQTVWTAKLRGEEFAYPDTLFGTDSHTTMVNGIAVLGWGVGGIEAEAAMLGQPIAMLIPDVVGFRLTGEIREGVTATDVVLLITQMLRKHGVVGKFVEFFGAGLDTMAVATRSTIANMAPEYGATCGFFPTDSTTLDYLRLTGRDEARLELVEAYAKAQGMWRDTAMPEPVFTSTLELDLSTVEPCISGPKRPQDRVLLSQASTAFTAELSKSLGVPANDVAKRFEVNGKNYDIGHGDVVIAAITSCTNTSNPYVMVAAGLVARKARALGLRPKPWVKTSLAPGSQVVTEYLDKSGLNEDLDADGFRPGRLRLHHLPRQLRPAGRANRFRHRREQHRWRVRSVRQPQLRGPGASASARQLLGEPAAGGRLLAAGHDAGGYHDRLARHTGSNGQPVHLKDIWPSNDEIAAIVKADLTRPQFLKRYGEVFKGPEEWQRIEVEAGTETLWLDRRVHLREKPALLRGHDDGARGQGGHRRCQGPRRVR